MMINSYPTVYNLGHKAILDIFSEKVIIQEKVDGSQISFGTFQAPQPGVSHCHDLFIRSKGAEIHIAHPGMFKLGVEAILSVSQYLIPGYTYRGEFLMKPKHNALSYDRVPANHIIIYDIQNADGHFIPPSEMAEEAARLGFEAVPLFFEGVMPRDDRRVENFTQTYLERQSVLGGQLVEGVVVKNYDRFGVDKKPLFGKYVSEKFKEVHSKAWKMANPAQADIVELLTARFRNEVRWMKAVHHLRDAGELEQSPRDIGKLMKEVCSDVHRECQDEIKEILFKWAWNRKLSRSVVSGLAEWYKEQLLEQQFAEGQRAELRASDEGMVERSM